jgi:two-component system, OmpR family, sensor kinase
MTSIRRRLLLWLLSAVVAGGLAASVVVFFQARQELNLIFDYQLRQLALTLRDRTYWPKQLDEVLQNEETLEFLIQVWSADGTLLYASHPQYAIPGGVQLGFGEVRTSAGRWRVFATQQRGLTIQVSQPMGLRDRVAFTASVRTLLPFVAALPLMGFLIWILVGRELRSLESTTRAIARRSPESLEPIETREVPVEIQPLVTALNDLLARLEGALGRQREFIADAAHELRTPLTALRLQLQLAERAKDDAARAQAHERLREGIARAVHLVEQLLALARQDPDAPVESAGAVDLAMLARGVVEAQEPAAAARGLALAVQAEEPLTVTGDRASLRTLIDNLVDNALRYTPSGGVTVRVAREASQAAVEVEDTGPGIPPADRGRVFDRFYRGEGASEGGTGLGLAIVKRIAERHGGTAELLDARQGPGLRVRIVLPLAPSPALSPA